LFVDDVGLPDEDETATSAPEVNVTDSSDIESMRFDSGVANTMPYGQNEELDSEKD